MVPRRCCFEPCTGSLPRGQCLLKRIARLERTLMAFLFVWITLSSSLDAVIDRSDAEKQERPVPDLVTKLNEQNPEDRKSAAEELAKCKGEGIAAALRKRVAIEKDFHVRLALHYAMAFHGDRQAL